MAEKRRMSDARDRLNRFGTIRNAWHRRVWISNPKIFIDIIIIVSIIVDDDLWESIKRKNMP